MDFYILYIFAGNHIKYSLKLHVRWVLGRIIYGGRNFYIKKFLIVYIFYLLS